MDSRTVLDYALFQLTPTRTRCDLVVCAGGVTEKLASGLLDPFLSHLRYAKDQISKGGYSITLRSNAAWFTKGTLERFVRFISTPEVLERFTTLEKEIVQIEKQIQSNELQNNDLPEGNMLVSEAESGLTSLSRDAPDGSDDAEAVPEENSKVRLRRILETRKAVLCKEQGMAFARALVAGFEMDYIDNLICFADAFGAHRMREACVNFMNLCKEKEEDRHWKDEIAAMQALSRPDFPFLGASGIMLASDDVPGYTTGIQDGGSMSGKSNNSGDASVADPNTDGRLPQVAYQDGRPQMPMPWPNHLHPYMKNLQGPFFPPMQPYPGYMMPNMQIPPSYFPGNGKNWPSTADDYGVLSGRESDVPLGKRSVKNKKKHSRRKASEDVETDESTDVSGSESGSESDGNERSRQTQSSKKHGKKSSRKVVIRNINYITSEREGRNDNSDDNSFSEVDGESIKHQVEKAVGSVHGHHKKKRESRNQFGEDGLKNAYGNDESTTRGFGQAKVDERNENWNAFQNLLMESRESDSTTHHGALQEEHFSSQTMRGKPNKSAFINDPLLMAGEDGGSEFPRARNKFDDGQFVHRSFVKKSNGIYEDVLVARNPEESSGGFDNDPASDYSSLTATMKMQKEKDWLSENQRTGTVYQQGSMDPRMVEPDYNLSFAEERKKKEIIADDSFMLEGRLVAYDHSLYPSVMDIEIVPNAVVAENPQLEQSQSNLFEPDDLYMMLDRNATDNAMASWTPELDYADDSVAAKVGKRVGDEGLESSENNPPSNVTADESQAASNKKTNKGARSKVVNGAPGKGKPDINARNRKPVPGSRNPAPKLKAQTEEERRRRMEELLVQRHKRIAERSSHRDLTAQVSSKDSAVDKEKLKPALRSSTVERLATTRVTVKSAQPTKAVAKVKEPSPKAIRQRTTVTESRKLTSKMAEPPKRKNNLKNSDGPVLSEPVRQGKKENAETVKVPPLEASTEEQPPQPVQAKVDFKDIPELPTNPIRTSEEKSSLKDETTKVQSYINLPTPKEDSTETIPRMHDRVSSMDVSLKHDDHKDSNAPDELTVHPIPSPGSDCPPSLHVEEVPSDIDEVPPPHAPEPQIHTPPPPRTGEITLETAVHSRKKWNSEDIQPKPAKGLRKLLLFGRKKISYA
ncbi:hypothetical protein MLD38_035211 [Melastoma candidum]|uniref:Uncharacterized protein n=1 Tax=Melastoma candidum TaxID=119954 RepID=A0ACB9MC40_9MYRT|nr:hypothetical protein MLD38_035211 [Melastoma candidum]